MKLGIWVWWGWGFRTGFGNGSVRILVLASLVMNREEIRDWATPQVTVSDVL